jgi:hypothetical protein
VHYTFRYPDLSILWAIQLNMRAKSNLQLPFNNPNKLVMGLMSVQWNIKYISIRLPHDLHPCKIRLVPQEVHGYSSAMSKCIWQLFL